MTEIRFDLDPERVERLQLRGILSESAKRSDRAFEDHRTHFLKITELPNRMSEGLSEDDRRLYDVTYYLRKHDEMGERYEVLAKELADSINRSLVFEFQYFDPAREDTEQAVSRLLDSVKRVIEQLDESRYEEFRVTSTLYGEDVEELYHRDTRPELDDVKLADERGNLQTENIEF